MKTSEQGLALIRQFEGFSGKIYLCPAGKMTIGYGHVVRTGEIFPVGGISLQEAEKLLLADIIYAEQAVTRLVGATLTQGQFDALVSLVYNTGEKAFEKSTLLRLLKQGDIAGASGQFRRWIYADGRKSAGLIRRRAAETAVFLQ